MSQTCCDARQYAPSEPLALHVHALSQAAQKMYICHVNRRATWQMNVRGDGGGLRQRPQVSGHNSAAIARPQAPCTFPNLQEYELNPHVFAACDTTSSDLSTHPTHDGLGLDVGERVEPGGRLPHVEFGKHALHSPCTLAHSLNGPSMSIFLSLHASE